MYVDLDFSRVNRSQQFHYLTAGLYSDPSDSPVSQDAHLEYVATLLK